MKLLKVFFICLSVALAGCQTMGGPSVKELDTMNKKMVYVYGQVEAIVNAANNMRQQGIINKNNFEAVDKVMQELFKAMEEMEQATNLAEMVTKERNVRSVLAAIRLVLTEILKHQGDEHAQRPTDSGHYDNWAYAQR